MFPSPRSALTIFVQRVFEQRVQVRLFWAALPYSPCLFPLSAVVAAAPSVVLDSMLGQSGRSCSSHHVRGS